MKVAVLQTCFSDLLAGLAWRSVNFCFSLVFVDIGEFLHCPGFDPTERSWVLTYPYHQFRGQFIHQRRRYPTFIPTGKMCHCTNSIHIPRQFTQHIKWMCNTDPPSDLGKNSTSIFPMRRKQGQTSGISSGLQSHTHNKKCSQIDLLLGNQERRETVNHMENIEMIVTVFIFSSGN